MGPAERAVTLALALGGAGVLVAGAVYGGRLVFEHAAGIPTSVLQNETQQRGAGHQHAPGEEHEHAAPDSVAPAGHVDPPGTPPHSHEPAPTSGHTHEPGAAPHEH
jgi:hypothetical protein